MKNITQSCLNKLKQIKEQCCCCDDENCEYNHNDTYNTSAGKVSSNPNRPNYDEFEQENEDPSYQPDLTRNQNWASNPIRNTKQDILYGCYALDSYAKKIKDLIIPTNSDFFNTPQFKDSTNEFNDALNKALLNLQIAYDTADYFSSLVNRNRD